MVIEPKTSGQGNHLDLGQVEAKPRARDQVEVYSRISPTRVRVVRNDLEGSDLAVRAGECVSEFRPSLIAEEPMRSSWAGARARPVRVAEPSDAVWRRVDRGVGCSRSSHFGRPATWRGHPLVTRWQPPHPKWQRLSRRKRTRQRVGRGDRDGQGLQDRRVRGWQGGMELQGICLAGGDD